MFFFDLDGTLLDSTSIWSDIDVAFLNSHGISPVPPDYTDYVTHHSAPDAAQYTKERFLLTETPQQIMDTWEEMALTAYRHTLPMKPGAKEFLLQCKAKGIRMAILTSCFPHLCHAALEHHNISHLFEWILTTRETGLEKGNGALYRMAATQCGLDPTQCTLFEDNPGYCTAARQEGFRIVGIRDPMFESHQEDLRQLCAPGHYITNFIHVTPEDFQ